MSDRIVLPRPATFDEALDNYLYLHGMRAMCSAGYGARVNDLNAHHASYEYGPEEKEAALGVMLAFAVQQREGGRTESVWPFEGGERRSVTS